MYKDFRHYFQTVSPKTGELRTWSGVGGVLVVNLFTLEAAASHGAKPGRATIENVKHCIKALVEVVETQEFKSLALPRLATGVGGLHWKDVKPLMEKHLGYLSFPLFCVTFWRSSGERKRPRIV